MQRYLMVISGEMQTHNRAVMEAVGCNEALNQYTHEYLPTCVVKVLLHGA